MTPKPTARQLTTDPGTALVWSEHYRMLVVDLNWYTWILLNTSAGKDSQAMIDFVTDLAIEQDCLHKLVAVHCDLGRIEWEGTRELAERQVATYGHRFEVVRNGSHADLLARIEKWGRWPGRKTRYCTSEFKTGQARTLATRLVRESALPKGQEVRILNCLGIRAQESAERAGKDPYKHHPQYQLNAQGERKAGNGWTNSLRWTDEWLPIFTWSADDVWARIKESGVEHHSAYDKGMPRLSCILCPLASLSANVLGAYYNPELAREYRDVEARMLTRRPDAKYSDKFTMAQVVELAEQMRADEQANMTVEDWDA